MSACIQVHVTIQRVEESTGLGTLFF